jgi:signal peptidase II
MRQPHRLRLTVVAAAAALLLDQSTRWVILNQVMAPARLIDITPFFNLTLGFNRGVSFGLFSSDEALGRGLLVGVSLAIVTWLLVWAWRSHHVFEKMALGAIMGGALGNVADRLRQGAVTDFLDLHALGWHWSTFNMADVAITGGVAMLVLRSFLEHPWRTRPLKTDRERHDPCCVCPNGRWRLRRSPGPLPRVDIAGLLSFRTQHGAGDDMRP